MTEGVIVTVVVAPLVIAEITNLEGSKYCGAILGFLSGAIGPEMRVIITCWLK
jgi:hypothetical protein